MIYLRFMYERAELPLPRHVSLHTDGTDWVDAQVRAEFDLLFPAARIEINPGEEEPFDLVVRVSRCDVGPAALRQWARRNARRSLVALGFYCLDPRQFDVVAPQVVDQWLRSRQIEHVVSTVRARYPRLWSSAARAYGRCVSFS